LCRVCVCRVCPDSVTHTYPHTVTRGVQSNAAEYHQTEIHTNTHTYTHTHCFLRVEVKSCRVPEYRHTHKHRHTHTHTHIHTVGS
jgi:hypothetical protein